MAVAFIALLLALSGASYAAVKLPARSVGARELKPKAVTRAAIKANAVDGSKVAADALTGSDIKESTLAPVPAAASATSAASSTHATAAAALDRVTYRGATGSVPPGDLTTAGLAGATATCDAGQVVTGGGVKVEDGDSTAVVDSYPDAGGRAWTARVDNADTVPHGFSVFAICVAAASVG